MSAYTGDIDYNSRNGKSTISCGKITLNYNDTLTISIGTGFPAGTSMSVDSVIFYNVTADKKKGDVEKGSWERSGGGTAATGVACSASGTAVQIKDTDTGAVDEDYFYEIVAYDHNTNPHTGYSSDPELVVRKRHATGGSAQAATAEPPKPEV